MLGHTTNQDRKPSKTALSGGREVPESCWPRPPIKTKSPARLPLVGAEKSQNLAGSYHLLRKKAQQDCSKWEQRCPRILLGHITYRDRKPSKTALSGSRAVLESCCATPPIETKIPVNVPAWAGEVTGHKPHHHTDTPTQRFGWRVELHMVHLHSQVWEYARFSRMVESGHQSSSTTTVMLCFEFCQDPPVRFLSWLPSTPHELTNTNSQKRNILITDNFI